MPNSSYVLYILTISPFIFFIFLFFFLNFIEPNLSDVMHEATMLESAIRKKIYTPHIYIYIYLLYNMFWMLKVTGARKGFRWVLLLFFLFFFFFPAFSKLKRQSKRASWPFADWKKKRLCGCGIWESSQDHAWPFFWRAKKAAKPLNLIKGKQAGTMRNCSFEFR